MRWAYVCVLEAGGSAENVEESRRSDDQITEAIAHAKGPATSAWVSGWRPLRLDRMPTFEQRDPQVVVVQNFDLLLEQKLPRL